jgi:hypothetical protein
MWMSITGGKWTPQDQKKHPQKRLQPGDPFFVEAKDNASSGKDHGTADQVWLLRHHANRFRTQGRILFHIFGAVQLVPSIQKVPMIAIANEFLEVIRSEPVFAQIVKVQRYALLLQETSCFAAGRSSGLVKEFHTLAGTLRFAFIHRCSP